MQGSLSINLSLLMVGLWFLGPLLLFRVDHGNARGGVLGVLGLLHRSVVGVEAPVFKGVEQSLGRLVVGELGGSEELAAGGRACLYVGGKFASFVVADRREYLKVGNLAAAIHNWFWQGDLASLGSIVQAFAVQKW